jgi:hypothetical protein
MSRRESESFRTTWRSMATEALEDRFEQLNLWRSGDERAPHKPLLILLAALAVSTVAWPIPAVNVAAARQIGDVTPRSGAQSKAPQSQSPRGPHQVGRRRWGRPG